MSSRAESLRQRNINTKKQQISAQVSQNDYDDRSTQSRRKTGAGNSGGELEGLKFYFMCLILIVIVLIFIGIYTESMNPIFEGIVSKLGYEKSQYAVVFDAGSTASRVLAYKFHKGVLDNKLILDDELFKERKPGLSSFAANPSGGAHTIKLLLDEARHFIPKDKWSSTPLVLKATAGLRLLPGDQAENILEAIRNLFTKSEFIVDENSVEIMDGMDEGMFSWFTVNFLLGRLTKQNQAAALDLGGGSTQVTFSVADSKQMPIYEKYVHPVHILGREVDVFTHSYLGLGLMAARKAIFTHGLPKDQTYISSECVNPIIANKTWIYGNTEYFISGKDNSKSTSEVPVVDFDDCMNTVRMITLPQVKPKPLTLKQHTIAAFSYYFDRAIETGLVDPFEGGEITVVQFRNTARHICSVANTDQPFMCLDLSYISLLLHEGLDLPDKKQIKLYKRIDGHEISWALGCAYNVLTTDERFQN